MSVTIQRIVNDPNEVPESDLRFLVGPVFNASEVFRRIHESVDAGQMPDHLESRPLIGIEVTPFRCCRDHWTVRLKYSKNPEHDPLPL